MNEMPSIWMLLTLASNSTRLFSFPRTMERINGRSMLTMRFLTSFRLKWSVCWLYTSFLWQYLRKWVKAAGIKKKITWHCARHSFAVNVLTKGANIKTVSSLLGHTSIKMTERYLHVVDSLKQDAINSLGEINYTPM